MKRTLIATTAALATLAGATSAFAQDTPVTSCDDLLALVADKVDLNGNFTLTNPERTIECEYEDGALVDTEIEGEDGLEDAEATIEELLEQRREENHPSVFGLETALRAIRGELTGEDQAQRARERAGQNDEDDSEGDQAQQGRQRGAEGRERGAQARAQAGNGGSESEED